MNCYPKVCVTGGSGYIGSLLVNKLLKRGYTVHATLRNLKETSKVDFLKSLPNADTNLVLFQADIHDANDFDQAIHGCEFVFHVATPTQHDPNSSQFKDTAEATVAGARSIVESCIRSKTVKHLIYTATVLAASPLNEDGNSFKSFPIVHVDDVGEAHIFCMENPSATGRFLCAVATPTSREIAVYFEERYPELKIDQRFMGEPATAEIKFDSSKLTNLGFVYKYDMKKILDESLECGKRLGGLSRQ